MRSYILDLDKASNRINILDHANIICMEESVLSFRPSMKEK
jgi:hypothetical protein